MGIRSLIGGLIAAAVILSACGSSSTSSPSSPSTTATAAVPTTTQTAQRVALAKYYKGTFGPLPASSPVPVKNKKIWVITLTEQSPSVANVAKGIQQAGTLLGWTTTIVDGKASPTAWNNGIHQAIAAHANAIVLDIVDCQSVRSALQQARAAGILVYGAGGSDDCNAPGVGLAPEFNGSTFLLYPGGVAAEVQQTGEVKAAWIASETGREGNVVEMHETDYLATEEVDAAFGSSLHSFCPSCSVTQVPFLLTDLGTQLGPKLSAALLKDPSANAVVFPYDTAVLLGGATAIENSRRASSLHVMGGECLTANVDLIRQNKGQNACVGIPYLWAGWAAVDGLDRLFNHQPDVWSGIGFQLIDRTHNLPGPGITYDGTENYQANYKRIWGLG
jgi:ribose transport system substrate-binding protein